MLSTFKHLFHGSKRPARAAHAQKKSRRAFLSVEGLEDRLVPAYLTVSSTVDDLSPGTLRSAINQVNLDGAQGVADSISFATGSDTQIVLQQGPLELTAGANVSIWGTGSAGIQMVVTGSGSNIFQVDYGAALDLHELTLAGGNTNANGGAINNAGTLTLSLCTFVDDTAGGMGGAIYNTGTLDTHYASTFSGNSAQLGGAVYNAAGATASLYGSFVNNSAGVNGGRGPCGPLQCERTRGVQ
jgi:hypothetical protein